MPPRMRAQGRGPTTPVYLMKVLLDFHHPRLEVEARKAEVDHEVVVNKLEGIKMRL